MATETTKVEAPSPKFVCVESLFKGIHAIGITEIPKDFDPRKQLPTIQNIVLLPGHNLVPVADWIKAKANGVTQEYLRKGKNQKLIEQDVGFYNLASASEEEAIERIENTVQNELLKRWEKAETRVSVRDALSKRIRIMDARIKDDHPNE